MKNNELIRHQKRRVIELVQQAMNELGGMATTYEDLAQALSEPLEEFGVAFSRQKVWSWGTGKALPQVLVFRFLDKLADEDSLPQRFSHAILQILALEETPAQKNIKELGYDISQNQEE